MISQMIILDNLKYSRKTVIFLRLKIQKFKKFKKLKIIFF